MLLLSFKSSAYSDHVQHKFDGCEQCWGKLLLKVLHFNIELLPKKVTNYVT